MSNIVDLEAMGHKLLYVMMLWGGKAYNKPYLFMRDHEGSCYFIRVKDDESLEIL